MQLALMVLVGLSAGVLSVLLGVGGGIIIVPALAFFAGMDIKVATGTSLAVIIPTAIVGAVKRAQLGQIDWRIALLVALGAIAGAVIGDRLVQSVSDVLLKRVFAALLIITAGRMLLDRQPPRPAAAKPAADAQVLPAAIPDDHTEVPTR
jgi:uncharacterized membrane protein YfcA